MAWIEFNINLTRCAEALERLAVVAERAFPVPEFHEQKLRGPETIVRTSPESIWEKQQERKRRRIRRAEGLPDEDDKIQS